MGRWDRCRARARLLGFRVPGIQGSEPRARIGTAHGLHGGRLCGWRLLHVPFSRWQRFDRASAGARACSKVDAGNWRALHNLGVMSVYAPGCYFPTLRLNWPVDIGAYRSVRSPDEPILLFMVRTPCQPGLPERDQHRMGRMELLETSFESFERNI